MLNFGVQKLQIFGTYGEFSVGTGGSQIRAQYILTKIKPGQDGTWENQLASQMRPWREVFNVDELTFEELIQRDLDDSRVAHDLIPYLLGESGHNARFFPPILAVLVPKRADRSSIAPYYPTPALPVAADGSLSFGDLFDFKKVALGQQQTPLAVIEYNSQRSAMVIVDGQHRAMAVLALHRQLNRSWGPGDAFSSYYSHIQVRPEDVAHVELPVCLIFFPDLYEGSAFVADGRIDLTTVSREIFTVVNKQAKEVSQSRALLLDDEDFAAYMMRQTLSHFKNRPLESSQSARIYSFAFGDSEADSRSQVMAGQLEYCSAVALHKMHAATAFGLPDCYSLIDPEEVTDGRKVKNPSRSVELLNGIEEFQLQTLSRRSAKSHRPSDRQLVIEKVGALTDAIMLPLFDRLRPFAVHNEALGELKAALEDNANRADPVQNKVRTLLFEGSGAKRVFEEHDERLKERATELRERGEALPTHLVQQMNLCDSVIRALQAREEEVRQNRAFLLFNIDRTNFPLNRDRVTVEQEAKILRARAKAIFDTLSTQAFQLGYLMTAQAVVEMILPDNGTYTQRLAATRFISTLLIEGLNSFFHVTNTRHRTLNGYVTEQRARAFEASEQGFRGLLAAGNVRELNEKQWDFFRWVILEIIHSRLANNAVQSVLGNEAWKEQAERYRAILPELLEKMDELRERYFEAAARTALNDPAFLRAVEKAVMEAQAKGASQEEADKIADQMLAEKRAATLASCKEHLKASLKSPETRKATLRRLAPINGATAGSGGDDAEAELEESAASNERDETPGEDPAVDQ